MIYIDPPYGIEFGSNRQVSTRKRDVKDGRAEMAATGNGCPLSTSSSIVRRQLREGFDPI